MLYIHADPDEDVFEQMMMLILSIFDEFFFSIPNLNKNRIERYVWTKLSYNRIDHAFFHWFLSLLKMALSIDCISHYIMFQWNAIQFQW